MERWKKNIREIKFKPNFKFELEESFTSSEDQNIFPYQILLSDQSLYFAQAAKKNEILYSTRVIVEYHEEHRILSWFDLYCS